MQSDCVEADSRSQVSEDNPDIDLDDSVDSDNAGHIEESIDADHFMNDFNTDDDEEDYEDDGGDDGVLFGNGAFPILDDFEDCDKSVTDKSERKNQLVNREKSLKCEICSKGFSRIGYLKLHMKVHERDPMFKCNLCPKQYTAKSNLKIHLKTHTGERPYKCGVCEHTSYSLSNLRKHMRIHTGERKHQCPVCERWFMEKTAMTNHVRLHSGEKPFRCDICDEAFVRKTSLKYHMSSHTGERKYTCTYCTRSFSHRGNLNQHLRLHTGETPFQCELCPRAFKSVTSLQYHKKVHLNTLAYKCGICQRQFVQNSHLTNHMRTHTGEKPYKCDVCEKSFAQKSSLNSHTRIHTGERPFVCEFCGKSYSHQYYLNQHRKQHPEYVPDPFAARITQHDQDFKRMLIKKLAEVDKNALKDIGEIKTELIEADVEVDLLHSKEMTACETGLLKNKKQQKKPVTRKKPQKKAGAANPTGTAKNKSAASKKRAPRRKSTSLKSKEINVRNTTLDFSVQNGVLLQNQSNSHLKLAAHGSGNIESLCNPVGEKFNPGDIQPVLTLHNTGKLTTDHQDTSSTNAQKTPILLSLMKQTKPIHSDESFVQQHIDRQMKQARLNSDISDIACVPDIGRQNEENSSLPCSTDGSLSHLNTSECKGLNSSTSNRNHHDLKGKYSILRAVLSNIPLGCTSSHIDAKLHNKIPNKHGSDMVHKQSESLSYQMIDHDTDNNEGMIKNTHNSNSNYDLSNVPDEGNNAKLALDTSENVSSSLVSFSIDRHGEQIAGNVRHVTGNSCCKSNTITVTDEIDLLHVCQTEQSNDPENTHSANYCRDTCNRTSPPKFSHSTVINKSCDKEEFSLSCSEQLSDKDCKQLVLGVGEKRVPVAESTIHTQFTAGINSQSPQLYETEQTYSIICIDEDDSSEKCSDEVLNDAVAVHQRSITVFDTC